MERLLLHSIFICSVLMLVLFILYRFTHKASWVDVGWAFGIGFLTLYYLTQQENRGLRHILMTSMVLCWSFRLGTYLYFRVLRGPEDGRYLNIQERWKNNLALKFFLFFQFQGLLDVLLATPALLVLHDPRTTPNGLEWIAFGLWVVAFIGESLSDHQLKQFKANPENRGKPCNQGLWRYSRHPNYFFEFLIWCAFALFATSAPFGIWTVLLPLMMLYFLLCVTGIPETEKQSLRTKGDAYRVYQQTTSVFVPWFPKKLKERTE